MFNLEGFIPLLCRLAQEVEEEDERARSIRSAALQALSALVPFPCNSVVFECIITSFLLLVFHGNVGEENIILYLLYAVILF